MDKILLSACITRICMSIKP